MNYVSLSRNNEYYVDEQTYEEIALLIKEHKHCMYSYQDRHPYRETNPCVAKNICLEHMLVKQPSLVYAGQLGADSSDRLIHRFIDVKGIIYTSIEDYSEEARQSMDETLSYYGFTPPTSVISRGKSVNFYAYYATHYGDLHTASVIVLSYNQYSEKVRGLFLLYKNGPTKELSKKSDLYRRAEELVEASKDASGEYHINGRTHANRYEGDVFEVISQLESATFNVVLSLQNGKENGGQDAQG